MTPLKPTQYVTFQQTNLITEGVAVPNNTTGSRLNQEDIVISRNLTNRSTADAQPARQCPV